MDGRLWTGGVLLLALPSSILVTTLTRPVGWRELAALASGAVGAIGLALLWRASSAGRRAPPSTPGGGRFIRRRASLLAVYDGPVPEETVRLQDDGHCVLHGVFTAEEVAALREEILDVFDRYPPDGRPYSTSEEQGRMYRYEMFNRSALCQQAMEHRRILDVIEPLLGDDCHVIANTAWRNPPRQESLGQDWHTDAGPHVPRPPGIAWPESIPYPIFVIGVHVYLQDCGLEDGPTGVIPGSHKSGQPPPEQEKWNDALSYGGRTAQAHLVKAGDVGMFVSDVWHRRMPAAEGGKGRFFLQINYGRRDIAQRLVPSTVVNQVGEAAMARAVTPRQKQLVGIHPAHFYDG